MPRAKKMRSHTADWINSREDPPRTRSARQHRGGQRAEPASTCRVVLDHTELHGLSGRHRPLHLR